MIKRFLLAGAVASVLLLSACYNKPTTSLKKPGDGPEHIHSGPSVGPGTTAGGSTAGPQPKPESHGGDVMPTAGGAHPAEGREGPPATPVHGGEGETPRTGTARTGNEKGAPDRGPEATHGAEKKH